MAGLNMNELAMKITNSEAGKKQVNIGQTKEILKFVAIICSDDEATLKKFLAYGAKASKKYAKGK